MYKKTHKVMDREKKRSKALNVVKPVEDMEQESSRFSRDTS